MAKTSLLCLMMSLVTSMVLSAEAQQPRKLSQLCYLGSSASEAKKNLAPFHKRLRDFGYVEGQNITFEYRYYEGKVARAPELADELVRIRCNIILTTGTEAVLAAKEATRRIPIVMGLAAMLFNLELSPALRAPAEMLPA